MVASKRGAAALEEEEFPRGGGDLLTPLERRRLAAQAKAAVDEELLGGTPANKKPRVGQPSQNAAEEEIFGKAFLQGKFPKHIELLKLKSLTPGMKLLGMVLETSHKQLTISLPHGLRGYVPVDQASDVLALLHSAASKEGASLRAALGSPPAALPSLPDLFQIGQIVRCTVTAVTGTEPDPSAATGTQGQAAGAKGGKPRVLLSLKLKDLWGGADAADVLRTDAVVPACVRTEEDRGYTLSFGLKGATGFLSKRDLQAHHGPAATLNPGALIEVRVTSPTDLRSVTVTSHPAAPTTPTLTADGLTLGSLLPGTLVNARVRSTIHNGLLLSFLTFFHGTVDLHHLPHHVAGEAWKAAFSKDQGAAGSSKEQSASKDGKSKGKGKGQGGSGGSKEQSERVQARVLYVDPATQRVGLSLLPHLLGWTMPHAMPTLGQGLPCSCTRARWCGGWTRARGCCWGWRGATPPGPWAT